MDAPRSEIRVRAEPASLNEDPEARRSERIEETARLNELTPGIPWEFWH